LVEDGANTLRTATLAACLVTSDHIAEMLARFIGLADVSGQIRQPLQPFAMDGFLGLHLSAFLSPRVVMPRYFIDYEDGSESLRDEEGTCYADLHAARDAAIAALPDIGREPPPADGRRAFRALVRDEAGTVLCTVTLNLAAECHPERQAVSSR
jgi:hypothetical protein